MCGTGYERTSAGGSSEWWVDCERCAAGGVRYDMKDGEDKGRCAGGLGFAG